MDRAHNGSNSRERRHFTPQQKLAIGNEHLYTGTVLGTPYITLDEKEAFC